MANWILRAKENVSSPVRTYAYGRNSAALLKKVKDLKKGYTITVAAPSTGGPTDEDVRGALLLAGFFLEEANSYVSGSWQQNFEVVKEAGETDFKLYNRQFDATQHNSKQNYSYERILENERSKEQERRKKIEEEAARDREESKDNDGCCPSSSVCDSISGSIGGSVKGVKCLFNSIKCVFGTFSD